MNLEVECRQIYYNIKLRYFCNALLFIMKANHQQQTEDYTEMLKHYSPSFTTLFLGNFDYTYMDGWIWFYSLGSRAVLQKKFDEQKKFIFMLLYSFYGLKWPISTLEREKNIVE